MIGSLAARCRSTWLLAAAVLGSVPVLAQCPGAIPYASNLSGSTLPACYGQIDNNADGWIWKGWGAVPPAQGFINNSALMYDGSGDHNADDYVFLPELPTTNGNTYSVSFRYRVAFGGLPVSLRVLYGDAPNVAAMTNVISDMGSLTNTAASDASFEFGPVSGPVYVAFHAYNTTSNAYALLVGNIAIEAVGGPPPCTLAAPTGLATSATTTTGTTLEWNPVGSAVDYEYEIRTSGAAGSGPSGLVTTNTTASTSAVVSGVLTANTSYTVYVRARCGVDDPSSTWSAGAVFSTPCNAVSLPYTQDFTSGTSFNCFTSQNTTTPPDDNYPYWGRFTNNWSTYGFTGATAAIFHGSGDPAAWMFLPPVVLQGGTEYQLSYLFGKANNTNATRYGALEVWYGSVPEGANMMATGTELADHGTFNHYATPNSLTFTPPSNGTYYIGFRCNGSFYSSTFTAVDDIVLEVAPDCAQPTSVTAAPAGDGLSVSWDCSGCSGDFIVEYGLSSNFTTPGSGTGAGTNGIIVSSNATSPLNIPGLVPGATYRVFVRQQCGVEYSDNSLATTGTATLPNTGCFDAIDVECGTTVSANTNTALHQNTGLCDAGTADTYGVWYAVTGDGGDFTLSTCAVDGGSASFNTRITVLTSDDCVNYACVASSAQPSGCGSVTWTTLPDAYYFVYVSGHSGTGERGAFTLALECSEPPTCFPPHALGVSGVTATEASLNWTNSDYNSSNEHVYELRTSGAPGSGPAGLVTSGNATSGSQSFNTLSGSTAYTFSVRADCGDDDYSNWVSTAFTTPCAAADIPYDAAFAGGTIPGCYTTLNVSGDPYTWVGATRAGFTNTNVAVYNNFDGWDFVPNDWLITQALNTTAGSDYRISLKHQLNIGFAAGAVGLQVYAGTSPDPGGMVLIQDLGDVATNVITPRTVDFSATGGPLYIGFKAGANTANSGWSFALYLGDIKVDRLDCEGTPNGTALPGTPCDDGDAGTTGDMWSNDCECEGTVITCTENVTVELRTDLNSQQASWEILEQHANVVLCSGGSYPANITTPIVEGCCLPAGCYRLRVMDSGGDGFVTGGYQLRESGPNGRRIIDNLGNFTNGSVSAIGSTYENGAFCVPIGDDKLIFSSCDKLEWVNNKFIVVAENPAVSAQYGVSNANSGYEFWFYEPNGGYSFRRFRSHSTSDGYGTGALRANHFKVNGWTNSGAAPHIPANTLLNVRVRGRVNGSNLPFGPACLFKIDAALAACPRVKLQDDPANVNDFSCGVTRNFGGSSNPNNRITANPPQPLPTVASSNVRYQFRFRIPGEGICIVRPQQTSARIVLNWTNGPVLEASKTYNVDVRVSLDGGNTWCFGPAATSQAAACADTEDWGKVCLVTIGGGMQNGGNNSMAVEGTNGSLTMYPNPNRGDQLFVSLSSVENGVGTVSVDIFDLTGKKVTARTIAVNDGFVNTALDLNGELASGMYIVNVTAGSKAYTERLVIQH